MPKPTTAQKSILDEISAFITGTALPGASAAPAALPTPSEDIVHDDIMALSRKSQGYQHDGAQFTHHEGNSLNAGDFEVRSHLSEYEQHARNLDYARRSGADAEKIASITEDLGKAKTKLLESAHEHAAMAGDALAVHHEAHSALAAEREAHLAVLKEAKEKAIKEAQTRAGKGAKARTAFEAEKKAIIDRHTQAVEHIDQAYQKHMDFHTEQMSNIGHDIRDLEAATGKDLSMNLGSKGSKALQEAEQLAEKAGGKKFGTLAAQEITTLEKTAEKNAGGIISRTTSAIGKEWNKGITGKASTLVGGVFVGKGALDLLSDSSKMMSGDKGLDKNGNPLPSPGILNLAWDAAEIAGGLALATGQVRKIFHR